MFSIFSLRRGILFALASCFFFASSSSIVHVLHEVQPIQTVFYRSFFQIIFTIPMLIYYKVNIFPHSCHEAFLLVFRGAAGSAALIFQFYAFQYMAVSDATVIIFSSPILTGILAYFIIGETWNTIDALATFLCFLGVLLIARPTIFFASSFDSKQHFLNSFIAFLGAILTSFSIIALKKLSAYKVHYLVPSFYLALVGTLLTGFISFYFGVFTQLICGHQILVLLIGFCAIGGQYLLTKALYMEKANAVALFRTFDIVLAFIFQLVFFNHNIDFFSVCGAVLVCFCIAIVMFGSKSENKTGNND